MRCPRCDYKMPGSDRFCGRCGLARPTDGLPIDPLLGLTVAGRYRIDRRIGVGGMGTVYLGTHVRVGQRVAIKVLHERYAGDRLLTQRFENEAMTYARVSHPNLVALHDFGRTADNCYFMVLEYCPGMALSKLVRNHERLDPSLIVEIIIQVAQGLGTTHAAGIIHRDLKPENVMLVEAGPGRYHVKLLDFGIAKRLDDDGPRLTQAGMVFGTPEYMAPEQARGDQVDGRSDIYALGCLLFELITGDPPFTGSNKLQIMHRQASEAPKKPSDIVDDVPPQLEFIALKCLEKLPKNRYQSTDEFIQALETVFGIERPTPVPPPTRLRQTAASAVADTDLTLAETRDKPQVMATDQMLLTDEHLPMDPPLPVIPRRAMYIGAGVVALIALIMLISNDDDAVEVDSGVSTVVTAEPSPLDAAPPSVDAAPPSALQLKVDVLSAPDAAPPTAPPTQPPVAPVTQSDRAKARKAKAKQNKRLAVLMDRAKLAFSRGRLKKARRTVLGILRKDERFPRAKRFKAQIDDVFERIIRAKRARKKGDCRGVLRALRPVLKYSPTAEVIGMVKECSSGMPPKSMDKP